MSCIGACAAVGLDKDVVENAPHYRAGEEPSYDRDYDREVDGHYGLT